MKLKKLRLGQYIKTGDFCNHKDSKSMRSKWPTGILTIDKLKVEPSDGCWYYRKVSSK